MVMVYTNVGILQAFLFIPNGIGSIRLQYNQFRTEDSNHKMQYRILIESICYPPIKATERINKIPMTIAKM